MKRDKFVTALISFVLFGLPFVTFQLVDFIASRELLTLLSILVYLLIFAVASVDIYKRIHTKHFLTAGKLVAAEVLEIVAFSGLLYLGFKSFNNFENGIVINHFGFQFITMMLLEGTILFLFYLIHHRIHWEK